MEFVSHLFKNKQRVAAIDIGSSSIKIVVMEKTGGTNTHPELSLEYELIEADLFDLINSRKTSQIKDDLKKTLQRLKIDHRIPIHLVVSKDLAMLADHEFSWPGTEKSSKTSYFKIPCPLDGSNDEAGDASVILMPKQHIFSLFRFFKKCGISPVSVNAGPLIASQALVYALHDDELFDPMAIIDMGASQTTCCVKRNDKVVSIALFNKGGNELTKMIAEKLKIREDDAEHVKRAEYERTLSVMHNVLDEFFHDIKKYFSYIKDSKNVIPHKIFIAGGAGRLTGIVYYLEDILKVPIQLWGIRGKVTLKKKLYAKRRFVYDEPMLAVALGVFVNIETKLRSFSISSIARFMSRTWRFIKCILILFIILFSIYGLGIYIENLGFVRDFIAQYEEAKHIEAAKERGAYLQLDGVNFSEDSSFALINNSLYKENDVILPDVTVWKIYQDMVALKINERIVEIKTSDYLILDQSAYPADEDEVKTTIFSVIKDKFSNK